MDRLVFLFLLVLSPIAWGQECFRSNDRPGAPSESFSIYQGGFVADGKSGLMWKRCAEGRSGDACEIGKNSIFTWKQALEHVSEVNFTGIYKYTDWRLPSIRELRSIVEEQCSYPAVNLEVFPNTESSSLWSSTPDLRLTGSSWHINFNFGGAGPYNSRRTQEFGVRLVRDSSLSQTPNSVIPLILDNWWKVAGGALSEVQDGLEAFGSGYRETGAACTSEKFDLRGANVYLKWSPKGAGYAGYGFRFLGSNDYYTGTILLYGPFTTSHTWNGSTLLQGGMDYFTRIYSDGSGTFYASTATGNYDDQGGSVILQEERSARTGMESYLSNASVCFGVWDNYAGIEESITLKQLYLKFD